MCGAGGWVWVGEEKGEREGGKGSFGENYIRNKQVEQHLMGRRDDGERAVAASGGVAASSDTRLRRWLRSLSLEVQQEALNGEFQKLCTTERRLAASMMWNRGIVDLIAVQNQAIWQDIPEARLVERILKTFEIPQRQTVKNIVSSVKSRWFWKLAQLPGSTSNPLPWRHLLTLSSSRLQHMCVRWKRRSRSQWQTAEKLVEIPEVRTVLIAPPVVVECVQPAPVAEHAASVTAIVHADVRGRVRRHPCCNVEHVVGRWAFV